ncbi:MAG: FMN-binding protein [Pelagibacterales bacterium]|nr:FMN-binding protein [Pelagibacterales bacterium]
MKNKYIMFAVLSLFFIAFCYNASAEDGLISKEQFIEKAFGKKDVSKGRLRFKEEVKKTAQKIMGSKYKKVLMRYWIEGNRTAWILNRIGKVKPITAGFIIDNCKIVSVHVLVYRESHGWEIKYPSFRDQFKGIGMRNEYKLDKSIDGISGATLSVNSMRIMASLALAMHYLVPDIKCP